MKASGEWALTHSLSHYTAPEELSSTESQVFNIEASQVPALSWAYDRYLNLIGVCDATFAEFAEAERRDHAAFFRGERVWSFGAAIAFMVAVCHLPQPECMAWLCKIIAAEVRGGLYHHGD